MPKRQESRRDRRGEEFSRWLTLSLAAQSERLTWKMVASRAGMSYSYLIQVKNGHEAVTEGVVQRLERALGRRFYFVDEDDALPAPPIVEEHYHLVPVRVRGRIDGSPMLVSYQPIQRFDDPRHVKYFLRFPGPVLGLSESFEADCLIDPEAVVLGPHPVLFAVRRGDGLQEAHWLREVDTGIETAANGHITARDLGLLDSYWTPLEGTEVLGRVEEVRVRMDRPPPE